MTPSLPPDKAPGDLSADSVDARIRELADLWDLWIRLELDRVDGKLSGPGIPTSSALSRARDSKAQPPPRPRADA